MGERCIRLLVSRPADGHEPPLTSVGCRDLKFLQVGQCVYQFTEADKVWNRACGQGECNSPRVGDAALTALITFHSLAMNGGVLHAIETCSEAQITAAASGYRFFGQAEAASTVEAALAELRGIQSRGSDLTELEDLESVLDARYATHVPDDQALVVAFERVFELRRTDFQSV